jgi:hypothetical protein
VEFPGCQLDNGVVHEEQSPRLAAEFGELQRCKFNPINAYMREDEKIKLLFFSIQILIYEGYWAAVFARPLSQLQPGGDPRDLHDLVNDAWNRHVCPQLLRHWRMRFLADVSIR